MGGGGYVDPIQLKKAILFFKKCLECSEMKEYARLSKVLYLQLYTVYVYRVVSMYIYRITDAALFIVTFYTEFVLHEIWTQCIFSGIFIALLSAARVGKH